MTRYLYLLGWADEWLCKANWLHNLRNRKRGFEVEHEDWEGNFEVGWDDFDDFDDSEELERQIEDDMVFAEQQRRLWGGFDVILL